MRGAYGPPLDEKRRATTYKGEEVWVKQRLTTDGKHPWRVIAACSATRNTRGQITSEAILEVLVDMTVTESNIGLEEPGAVDRITDPDFGWFLYEFLGGPSIVDAINRANQPDYLGKLRGLPRGVSAAPTSEPPTSPTPSTGTATTPNGSTLKAVTGSTPSTSSALAETSLSSSGTR